VCVEICGLDLVDWGRGSEIEAALFRFRVRPRFFFAEEQVAPTSLGGWGLGVRSGPALSS
jgi:hypothetical protein